MGNLEASSGPIIRALLYVQLRTHFWGDHPGLMFLLQSGPSGHSQKDSQSELVTTCAEAICSLFL